ncbi:MAG: hypothetical protein AAB601_00735, partial [Patescibacteria group bacterium]
MTEAQTKKCQNCHQSFTIAPDDFLFYERLAVPPPTWCPRCRLQRRLGFKNERTLYKRTCDLCKRDVIAIFPAEAPFPVYCPECWFSDKWDALDYGQVYDPQRGFFEQFVELRNRVPKVSLYIDHPRTVGGTFMNLTGPVKNCYLIFLAEDDENCMYSYSLFHSKNAVDCTKTERATSCYELVNCQNCYRTVFSVDCRDCVDIAFSKNLANCSDCFGCANLRNKKFHIWNEPHGEAEYRREVALVLGGSYEHQESALRKAEALWREFPSKFMHGYRNADVSGEYLYNCKNVHQSFEVVGGVDNKYCHVVNMGPTSNCYDYGDWGNNASLMYECVNCGENIANVRFSYGTWIGEDMEYCDVVIDSKHMFGCVCARKKEYCILNKRYSKDEYRSLRERIIRDMNERPYTDRKGRAHRYGEFFPLALSHYPYEDTAAFDFFPLSAEEVRREGYRWRAPETRGYEPTLRARDLPDRIQDVSDSILTETIECDHAGVCNDKCTTAFRIIPEELAFYREMSLPLPRLCHNCRHYRRFRLLNPPHLWHRSCQCAGAESANGVYFNTGKHHHEGACPNEFETSYSPDRKE